MSPPELRAVHEAGHAVMMLLCGFDVGQVTIEVNGDSGGSAHWASNPEITPESGPDLARIYAAGMGAERLIFGSHYWGGSSPGSAKPGDPSFGPSDVDRALRREEKLTSDLDKLALCVAYLDGGSDRARELVEAWIGEVAELLRPHIDELLDLSDALLERGRLTGDEVHDILDDALFI